MSNPIRDLTEDLQGRVDRSACSGQDMGSTRRHTELKQILTQVKGLPDMVPVSELKCLLDDEFLYDELRDIVYRHTTSRNQEGAESKKAEGGLPEEDYPA